MINIKKFISALKVAWVRRIVHNVQKKWHLQCTFNYSDLITLPGQSITLLYMHFLRKKVTHLAYIKGFLINLKKHQGK